MAQEYEMEIARLKNKLQEYEGIIRNNIIEYDQVVSKMEAKIAEMAQQLEGYRTGFKDIQLEMRLHWLAQQFPKFRGDSRDGYRRWLAEMGKAERMLLENDEMLKVLALVTLEGAPADMVKRMWDGNPNITWRELQGILSQRYWDESERDLSRRKLRNSVQREGQTVLEYYEELLALATEIYGENVNDDEWIQSELVGIFIDGVHDNRVARKLIKRKPKTLSEALEVAIKEQQADRSYNIRRGAEPKPMEVDAISKGSETSEGLLRGLVERLEKLEVRQLFTQRANSRVTPPMDVPPRHHSWPPNCPDAQSHSAHGQHGAVNRGRQNTTPPRGSNTTCYQCGGQGHFARECPKHISVKKLVSSQEGSGNLSRLQNRPSNIPPKSTLLEWRASSPQCALQFDAVNMKALVDPGARISVMRWGAWLRLPHHCCIKFDPDYKREIRLADGKSLLEVKGNATLKFKIGSQEIVQEFVIIKDLPQRILLGTDFFTEQAVVMDHGMGTIAISGETHPLIGHISERKSSRPKGPMSRTDVCSAEGRHLKGPAPDQSEDLAVPQSEEGPGRRTGSRWTNEDSNCIRVRRGPGSNRAHCHSITRAQKEARKTDTRKDLETGDLPQTRGFSTSTDDLTNGEGCGAMVEPAEPSERGRISPTWKLRRPVPPCWRRGRLSKMKLRAQMKREGWNKLPWRSTRTQEVQEEERKRMIERRREEAGVWSGGRRFRHESGAIQRA